MAGDRVSVTVDPVTVTVDPVTVTVDPPTVTVDPVSVTGGATSRTTSGCTHPSGIPGRTPKSHTSHDGSSIGILRVQPRHRHITRPPFATYGGDASPGGGTDRPRYRPTSSTVIAGVTTACQVNNTVRNSRSTVNHRHHQAADYGKSTVDCQQSDQQSSSHPSMPLTRKDCHGDSLVNPAYQCDDFQPRWPAPCPPPQGCETSVTLAQTAPPVARADAPVTRPRCPRRSQPPGCHLGEDTSTARTRCPARCPRQAGSHIHAHNANVTASASTLGSACFYSQVLTAPWGWYEFAIRSGSAGTPCGGTGSLDPSVKPTGGPVSLVCPHRHVDHQ